MDTPQPTPSAPAMPVQPVPVAPTPSPMPPAPQVSAKKSSGWLVVLIIALVAVGAYVTLAFSQSLWPFTPVATPSPSPTVSATPDTTAGWKTYTNTQYGFEFKYPAGFGFLENRAFDIGDKEHVLEVVVDASPALDKANSLELFVSIDKGTLLSDAVAYYKRYFTDTTVVQKTIGSIEFTLVSYDDPGNKQIRDEIAMTTKNGFLYSFTYVPASFVGETLEQMLATFTFTK